MPCLIDPCVRDQWGNGGCFLPLDCLLILATAAPAFVKKEGGEELGILIGKYLISVLFCFLSVIRPLKVFCICQALESWLPHSAGCACRWHLDHSL